MPHTLVTGANSFVSAHVISTLISQGHTVTGSVRRASAGEALLKLHPEWKDSLDFIQIENYSAAGVWDEFFKSKDVEYIVHVAGPMVGNEQYTDYERDWLQPAVEK
jgi:nucleoside-diphosphate-sugar epimerase